MTNHNAQPNSGRPRGTATSATEWDRTWTRACVVAAHERHDRPVVLEPQPWGVIEWGADHDGSSAPVRLTVLAPGTPDKVARTMARRAALRLTYEGALLAILLFVGFVAGALAPPPRPLRQRRGTAVQRRYRGDPRLPPRHGRCVPPEPVGQWPRRARRGV